MSLLVGIERHGLTSSSHQKQLRRKKRAQNDGFQTLDTKPHAAAALRGREEGRGPCGGPVVQRARLR